MYLKKKLFAFNIAPQTDLRQTLQSRLCKKPEKTSNKKYLD